MDEYVWLPSTLLARTICPYHQCYLLYNLSFCACLVVYRAASLTSIWLVGSPLVVLNAIKTWIRKIVHPKWKETRQLMNEWKATKVHVYVQCFNFLSKPERTYWSLTPQLDTVIIELGLKPYGWEAIHGDYRAKHFPSQNSYGDTEFYSGQTSYLNKKVLTLATGLLHHSTSSLCIHSTFDGYGASLQHQPTSLKSFTHSTCNGYACRIVHLALIPCSLFQFCPTL